MSLKSVKAKIKSVDKTRQVTKAMEAVSAVKMRKAQAIAISLRGYARAALSVLRGVAASQDALAHPLLTARKEERIGLVVVSPDKGLAGSLVANILKKATRFIDGSGFSKEAIAIFAIGRKANDFFSKRGFAVNASYEKWGDIADYSGVEPLIRELRGAFESGKIDAAYIVYTQFHSTLQQEVVVRKMLPISFEGVAEIVEGIVPEKGKFSDLRNAEAVSQKSPLYVFEPSPIVVLDAIVPRLLQLQLYHAVLEANASEHSARMIAMKNASDNAKDLSRALKLSYNRVRQAAITREVSEIVGGMESMKAV